MLAMPLGIAVLCALPGTDFDKLIFQRTCNSRHQPGYFTRSISYVPQRQMNAHFLGFECPIQFVPSATRPIEPRCGTPAALFRHGQRLWPSSGTNIPQGLFVPGLSLAGTSPGRRHAFPAHRITAHSDVSLVKNPGWSARGQ